MDVIGLGAFIVTAIGVIWSIYWGVRQWKAQKEFELYFDIAKRLSYLAFKFEDDFLYAQNPIGPAEYEYKDRPKTENESELEKNTLNSQYGHLNRLTPLKETIIEMKTVNWEAKSTIGLDCQPYIDNYIRAFTEVRIAILTVFSPFTQKLLYSDRPRPSLYSRIEEANQILYGYEAGQNLREYVNQTTKDLTAILSKYTFGKLELLEPTISDFDKASKSPRLNLDDIEKSAKELADAKERLSEIEASYRANQLDAKNEMNSQQK